MTVLAVVALLIAATTAWYLARPLARAAVADDRERRHQLEQLRDRLLVQLDELDVEEADRNIDATVLGDERSRLEAELARALRELEALKPKQKQKKKKTGEESRRAWVVTLVLAGVVLPLSAAGLYALNQKDILAQLANPEAASNAAIPPKVMEMVQRLEKRLEQQPDDADGWFRLGRAYAVLGRPQAASAAYARAYQLTPDNPELIAEYAAFLYNQDPENIGSQVSWLFNRLLKLDPQNRDALWFAGFASYQQGEYKKAIGYWERLLKVLPPDSQEALHLRAVIAKTRENPGKK